MFAGRDTIHPEAVLTGWNFGCFGMALLPNTATTIPGLATSILWERS
jgi:hypothetical protein